MRYADTEYASFVTPDAPARLAFQLAASDGGQSSTDKVLISVVPNPAPVAVINDIPWAVDTGSRVELDGSRSYDPQGTGSLTYAWEQTCPAQEGTTACRPAVSLQNANTATPWFIAPDEPADLQFKLTVTDARGATGSDTALVVVATPVPAPVSKWLPLVTPGNSQNVLEGELVTPGGSGSSDQDGSIVAYRWEQVGSFDADSQRQPVEQPVALTDADRSRATFTAPTGLPGNAALRFRLTVTDNDGGTASQEVVSGAMVTLQGSGSGYPGETVSYQWSLANRIGGPPVTLSDAGSSIATSPRPW